jgi:hypothetical protein
LVPASNGRYAAQARYGDCAAVLDFKLISI